MTRSLANVSEAKLNGKKIKGKERTLEKKVFSIM